MLDDLLILLIRCYCSGNLDQCHIQEPCITMCEYLPSAVPYPAVARDPVLQCVSTHLVQYHILLWPGALYYIGYSPRAVPYPAVARDPVLQCVSTHPEQSHILLWPGALYYNV